MGSGKILGVLGGMGPAASAQFMMELAQRKQASCDQEHPVVYLLSDPTIPDRSSAIMGHGENPGPQLRADIEKLIGWGADVIAVPCNTAHYFIDAFKDDLPVPLVHIMDVTLDAAKTVSPDGAWIVSTLGTLRSGSYQKWAQRKEYSLHTPPEHVQQEIQQIVEEVKAGRTRQAGDAMTRAMEELWRALDIPVIMACTELPLAYAASGLPPEKSVSSITALAEASLRALEQ